jgi:hypothetical protein
MQNPISRQFEQELREHLLQAAIAKDPKGFASEASNKFDEVQSWLADQLGLPEEEIAILWAGDQNNISGRAKQARTHAQNLGRDLTLTVLVTPMADQAARHASNDTFMSKAVMVVRATASPKNVSEITVTHVLGNEDDIRILAEIFPTAIHQGFLRSTPTEAPAATNLEVEPRTKTRLEIDPRVDRMVKVSLGSKSALILVGPPGTGKSHFLREVIEDARRDPGKYGLTKAPAEPKWITAEEGWTTRDLVGGETVDEDQRLRFALGHVLDAIRQDRWLIVDEMNRADMDKIFGALMTWLSQTSDKEFVDIGRVSTSPHAPPVQLGWAAEVSCSTVNLSRLTEVNVGEAPVRFLAGREWRLLGTYNAVDAHRVFRFGQALGRRFVRVPIPASPPEQFAKILANREIEQSIAVSLNTLYSAHYSHPSTRLGPSLFLDAEPYIRAAVASGAPLTEALAEGYLITVGSWLAALDDDDLKDLGIRIRDANALPKEEWDWVCSMILSLR